MGLRQLFGFITKPCTLMPCCTINRDMDLRLRSLITTVVGDRRDYHQSASHRDRGSALPLEYPARNLSTMIEAENAAVMMIEAENAAGTMIKAGSATGILLIASTVRDPNCHHRSQLQSSLIATSPAYSLG